MKSMKTKGIGLWCSHSLELPVVLRVASNHSPLKHGQGWLSLWELGRVSVGDRRAPLARTDGVAELVR